jgi:hypothetical protein
MMMLMILSCITRSNAITTFSGSTHRVTLDTSGDTEKIETIAYSSRKELETDRTKRQSRDFNHDHVKSTEECINTHKRP